jgi:transcription initiation factor TFIID TATA-box-binding protein
MRVTNVVFQASWKTPLDLAVLATRVVGARYDPRKFSGLIWKDVDIGGSCLVFSNGTLICSGAKSLDHGREVLAKYTDTMQRHGWDVTLNDIKLLTMSACHKLSGPIDLTLIPAIGGTYEPELFNGAMLKREGIHYTLFATGSVIIMGMKPQLEDDVYAMLLELELSVKS